MPVDSVVRTGRADVDQSRITGESLPVQVGPGDRVPAGSITRGALELQVERVGEDSSYGRIVAAVRRAQSSRAPVQRLADRLAARIVYLALAAALVTFLATRDARATISVIIVAGACGVAAGTPLAVLAAIARAARCGAFVKDGTPLERLSAVDTVVLDKTGTLTAGAPRVVAVSLAQPAGESTADPMAESTAESTAAPAAGEDEVLALAAAAEWNSEHPIGRAICTEAAVRDLTVPVPDDVIYSPGAGVSARVKERWITVGRREGREHRAGQAVQETASAADTADDAAIVSDTASDPEAPSATSVVEVRQMAGSWAPSPWPTGCARGRPARCETWAAWAWRSSCSPATRPPPRPTWPTRSAWRPIRCAPGSCPPTRRRSSALGAGREGAWPWWATASTTPRR